MNPTTEQIGKYIILLHKSVGKEKHHALDAVAWYSRSIRQDHELLEYINDNWDKHHNTK
jgi:hypothetical protein